MHEKKNTLEISFQLKTRKLKIGSDKDFLALENEAFFPPQFLQPR